MIKTKLKKKGINNNYNMKNRTFKKIYKKKRSKETIKRRNGIEELKCFFFFF